MPRRKMLLLRDVLIYRDWNIKGCRFGSIEEMSILKAGQFGERAVWQS